jgi:hypothetical protein
MIFGSPFELQLKHIVKCISSSFSRTIYQYTLIGTGHVLSCISVSFSVRGNYVVFHFPRSSNIQMGLAILGISYYPRLSDRTREAQSMSGSFLCE